MTFLAFAKTYVVTGVAAGAHCVSAKSGALNLAIDIGDDRTLEYHFRSPYCAKPDVRHRVAHAPHIIAPGAPVRLFVRAFTDPLTSCRTNGSGDGDGSLVAAATQGGGCLRSLDYVSRVEADGKRVDEAATPASFVLGLFGF